LREATFIDTDFTSAKLNGAQFAGANWRNVRGLANAAARGATGVPDN
jgi:uncharacterized protein YjbI with pentapeptide repeats